MPERRLTPLILALLCLIVTVSGATIVTGRVELAAVVGGFIPLRIAENAEFVALVAGVPLWLTPLSATLLHGGWAHLAFNMLMLAIVGASVEAAIGRRGVLVAWVVGAYAAAAAQWGIDPASPAPMIGASGALSALVGAYSLLYGQSRARAIGPVPAHIVHALWLGAAWTGLNLLIGWFSMRAGMPVAGAAHVGGFLAGMLLLRPLLRWRWAGRADIA